MENGIRQPWIPAYAGMTQCYHGQRAQQPWIPAYAGMTQYYHGEREQQPWIPAYAGMTQCYHGEREQQPWIPAYAGMTQCYHGEREQQPWISAYAGMTQYYHGEREQQPWIPAYAGMTQCYHGEREQQPWIPAHPRTGKTPPSFPRRRESIGHPSDPHWGFFLESTESSIPGSIFQAILSIVVAVEEPSHHALSSGWPGFPNDTRLDNYLGIYPVADHHDHSGLHIPGTGSKVLTALS